MPQQTISGARRVTYLWGKDSQFKYAVPLRSNLVLGRDRTFKNLRRRYALSFSGLEQAQHIRLSQVQCYTPLQSPQANELKRNYPESFHESLVKSAMARDVTKT
jgi:hypothetical protein